MHFIYEHTLVFLQMTDIGTVQNKVTLDYENCLTYLFITKKQLIIAFFLYKKSSAIISFMSDDTFIFFII